MKAVNGWTKNRSCLLSIEIPYNIQKSYSIDLFPKHENHWSARATKKRQTAVNNAEELKASSVQQTMQHLGYLMCTCNLSKRIPNPRTFSVSPIHTRAP
jgi:hypothetical protein